MSIRKITASEIQAVGTILKDKDAIELLKKINQEVVTEEDTKGKRKQNDIFQFIGFAHQDDILGEDSESDDFKNKAGSVKTLVDAGLILEGSHTPLERKSEKNYGDARLPAPQDKRSKYKLTEEGLTLLAIVGDDEEGKQVQQQETRKSNNIVPDDSKQQSKNNKSEGFTESLKKRAIAAFKEDVKEENR